jgi:hypothetical protein
MEHQGDAGQHAGVLGDVRGAAIADIAGGMDKGRKRRSSAS